MMFKSNIVDNKKANIEMTPIIDIVFLLLIFFMLTSSFILQPGIKVNVPKAKSSDVIEKQEYIVTIDKKGHVYFKDKHIDIYNLYPILQNEFTNVKDAVLIIKADKDVSYGIVINVMDIAKQAGVNKIAVSTEPSE